MADQILAPGLLAPPAKPLSMLVTTHDKQVVLHFSEPRAFVGLTQNEPIIIGTQLFTNAMVADPGTARSVIDMAMAIIDHAYELRGDLKPAGGAVKHALIERHRATLTKRVELILNTRREQKRINNAALAVQILDVCLAEIFS